PGEAGWSCEGTHSPSLKTDTKKGDCRISSSRPARIKPAQVIGVRNYHLPHPDRWERGRQSPLAIAEPPSPAAGRAAASRKGPAPDDRRGSDGRSNTVLLQAAVSAARMDD